MNDMAMGDHDDDGNLRGSMHEDDARHDRRSMMRKLHSRTRNRSFTDQHGGGGNDAAADGGDLDDSYANEILEEVQAAHEEDEYNLAGRVEDGEEVMDALNQALTSPPANWWSMRKQWQNRTRRGGGGGRGVMNFLGNNNSGHDMGDDDAEQTYADEQDENLTALDYAGIDSSARSASGALLGRSDAGVVGHPVMTEAPIDIGYDVAAYRKNPFLRSGKRKRSPTVVYVTKETLHKRRAQQVAYLIAALSTVFLFMFFLEQRKLSHYAMVQSPISLSAYLAGEGTELKDKKGEYTTGLEDLGLQELASAEVAEVQFNEPAEGEQQPVVEVGGDAAGLPGQLQHQPPVFPEDRFDTLRRLVVEQGASEDSVFDIQPMTPQRKALNWLAFEDGMRLTPDNDHWIKKIVQRYALATFYFSTNGQTWDNSYHFLTEIDECNWNGKVKNYIIGAGWCNGGYIQILALWDNNLTGRLPPELGALTTLRTLSVFDNHLKEPPPESLTKLVGLWKLHLQKNDFRGDDISYLCGKIPHLKELKSDCGKKGGVVCPCCTECGYNARTAFPEH
mmetsp:Transcript_34860/g.78210  ORF Transcript_34860/g.78210 Transcript_34860/m.78210 type:complete len:562 (+) Transcript_34860:52-1737(+)